ncbi:hypothetical protein SZ54_3148 [Rhizobium sp. UR51a]|nr:hypothetical protein SZ54_3148 [Rhizobium sp. UR51a]
MLWRMLTVFKRHSDGAARKGFEVYPRQSVAAIADFFDDDAAAGFLHGGETAPGELGEKRGFSAAGATGEDDETVHGCAFLYWGSGQGVVIFWEVVAAYFFSPAGEKVARRAG